MIRAPLNAALASRKAALAAPDEPAPHFSRRAPEPEASFERIDWLPRCGAPLLCGGSCVLALGHVCPCECVGDDPGDPDTCPA